MIKFLNKIEPKKRFFIVYSLIGLAQIFALLFPIAYPLDKLLGKKSPLWFIMDDTRFNDDGSLAEDYRIYRKRFKYGWIATLAWHITRNRIWNFVELFLVENGSPEFGNQHITGAWLVKDELYYMNGRPCNQTGRYAIGAGLKYVGDPGDSPWQVNSGDIISEDHSIIGEGEMYYSTPSGWTGWRKTSCKKKKLWYLFGATRWVTFYAGMNANRYAFKWKHQKDKPIGTWPEM